MLLSSFLIYLLRRQRISLKKAKLWTKNINQIAARAYKINVTEFVGKNVKLEQQQ
jgi:hypothetical protein